MRNMNQPPAGNVESGRQSLPPLYVNRDEQIDAFTEALERIRSQRPVPSTLFEWYGSPGIGKSTLVALLRDECKKRGVPSVLVNFKEVGERVNQYLDDPVTLVEDMATSFAEETSADLSHLQNAVNAYRAHSRPESVVWAYFEMSQEERLFARPEWLQALHTVTLAFVNLFKEWGQPRGNSAQPVVIFFDETEKAHVELVDWIEEWVINPLTQVKHCVIVWTARRPWRWKRPEIRRRWRSEALDVFEEEEVKEQVQRGSANISLAELLFKNVHSVTGGHPYANRVVISQLNEWGSAGQTLTPEYLTERQSDLLRGIFTEFIRGYALSELEPELRTACELLAMVRLFDTTMLRAILQASGDDKFKKWSQEDFGDLLLRLKRTQLLVWGKGYALDESLRYIIRNYFFVCDKPTYIGVNKTALNVYQTWLEKPAVDNRGLFVIEELYHQACLSQAGEAIDLEAEFAKRLGQYRVWIEDPQAFRNALERLEGDLNNDNQLDQLTEGLSKTKLVEQVQKAMRQNP